jgi:hypothetical protein
MACSMGRPSRGSALGDNVAPGSARRGFAGPAATRCPSPAQVRCARATLPQADAHVGRWPRRARRGEAIRLARCRDCRLAPRRVVSRWFQPDAREHRVGEPVLRIRLFGERDLRRGEVPSPPPESARRLSPRLPPPPPTGAAGATASRVPPPAGFDRASGADEFPARPPQPPPGPAGSRAVPRSDAADAPVAGGPALLAGRRLLRGGARAGGEVARRRRPRGVAGGR